MISALVSKKKKEISFSDYDLPMEGKEHNKPLYIRVKVKGKKTTAAIVVDGSVINVCPRAILSKLSITQEELKQSNMVIRAYDDTKRNVDGTFKAMVKAGPMESMVEFTVLDIPAIFSLLLGRSWFHELEGVPSTLHQTVRVPMDNFVVTIHAEKGNTVATLGTETTPLIGFQIVGIFKVTLNPTVMKMMRDMTYMLGMGLGKNGKGIAEFPDFKGQLSKKGLSYEKCEVAEEKKGNHLSNYFIKEGHNATYQGEPELWMLNGETKPGFEIFADFVRIGNKVTEGTT